MRRERRGKVDALMKIPHRHLHRRPRGEIWLEGRQVVVGGGNHARELGLSIIHQ